MSKPKTPLQRMITAYVGMTDEAKAQVLDVLRSIYTPPPAKARKRITKPVNEATPLGTPKRGRSRKQASEADGVTATDGLGNQVTIKGQFVGGTSTVHSGERQ